MKRESRLLFTKAVERISEELKTVDIDEMWSAYQSRHRWRPRA